MVGKALFFILGFKDCPNYTTEPADDLVKLENFFAVLFPAVIEVVGGSDVEDTCD